MYSIYADDLCIYNDTSDALGVKLTAATLSLEDNAAGSLEFTMPVTNVGYDEILKMYTHIQVFRDGEKIWGGRPLSESTDFYKNKTIFCEGELAYLNDTYQPVAEYHDVNIMQFLKCILQVHNNKCNGDEDYTSYGNGPPDSSSQSSSTDSSTYDFYPSADTPSGGGGSGGSGSGNQPPGDQPSDPSIGHRDKRIYLGSVTVHDDYGDDYRNTSYESTLETINGIVKNYGGHIRIRTGANGKLYLDYFKNYIKRSTQVINFGQNLLDYTRSFDMSNLCTVLLPLGAKKDESDLVGDEIPTHWNRRSLMLSTGEVLLGKNFKTTYAHSVTSTSTYQDYRSSSDSYTETTYNNVLLYTGTQIDGYVMWAFYDENWNLVSSNTASGSIGYQSYNRYPVQIPSDAAYVRFGYYYDGGKYKQDFEARYTTWNQSLVWNAFEDVVGYNWDGNLITGGSYENAIIDPETGLKTFLAPDDYVVSNPIPAKEKDNFFITARQDQGRGMYCAYLADGRPLIEPSMAGTGVGFTDWEKNKVTCPVGTDYIIVAGKTGVEMNPVVYGDFRQDTTTYVPPEEYVTIESVNDGSLYLASPLLLAIYGWIERQVQWEDMKTPEALLDRAEQYMEETMFDDMVLEIKAFDLHLIQSGTEAIDILDKVRCVSTPHGLDKILPVTKLEIPLLEPQNATFTLGEERSMGGISGGSVVSEASMLERIADQPKPSSILRTAKANATSLINQKTNGFVEIGQDEILIMDAPDKANAQRLWRMNVNGIGYSSDGYAGTFGLALTMDGSIVADRITTGHMHADRIRGGSLILGGYDNVNGEFYMKNSEGKNFVKMTKDGTEMIAKISQVVKWSEVVAGSGGGTRPRYGVIELNQGSLTGYTAEIRTKLSTQEAQNPNWWKTYSFSFDDVTSKTAQTSITLMNPSNSGVNWGIDIHSASYFSLWLDSIGNYDLYSPHIELIKGTDQGASYTSGAFIIGRSGGSAFCGLYYNGEATDFHSGDGRSYFGNKVINKTLILRNDNGPSGDHSTWNNGLGYGGIYIVSDGNAVSVEGTVINMYSTSKSLKMRGTRIHMLGDDISIKKGNTLLTAASGRIPIVTSITSNGDGSVSWNYDYISIENGFVVGMPAGSSISSGSYDWPGFGYEADNRVTLGGGGGGGFSSG